MESRLINEERLQKVKSNLLAYYNYKAEKDCLLIFDENIIDVDNLRIAYRILINEPKCETSILDTLQAVYHYVQEDNLGLDVTLFNVVDNMVRPDLLRLYILTHDHSGESASISVSSGSRKVKLRNFCNWFLDDMTNGYLKRKLPDIHNLEQAKSELRMTCSHKGNLPTDPRILKILWGTYNMLHTDCTFNSLMPGKLCQFILVYLQMIGIIPFETDIDELWIRNQLRRIISCK